MKYLIVFIFFLCFIVDTYSFGPNRHSYIWAKHGLNLREAPSTNSKVIAKLSFGDSLMIIETTRIKYTNLLVKPSGQEKHPILLKSHWVKVRANGIEGYLINGYLLNLPCPKPKEVFYEYLLRMSERFPTSVLDVQIESSLLNQRLQTKQIEFSNGKRINFELERVKKGKKIESESDYGSEFFKYFYGFSIQQVLVFFEPFFGIEHKEESQFQFKVLKNWKDSIWLSDGSMRDIKIQALRNNIIIFYFEISC